MSGICSCSRRAVIIMKSWINICIRNIAAQSVSFISSANNELIPIVAKLADKLKGFFSIPCAVAGYINPVCAGYVAETLVGPDGPCSAEAADFTERWLRDFCAGYGLISCQFCLCKKAGGAGTSHSAAIGRCTQPCSPPPRGIPSSGMLCGDWHGWVSLLSRLKYDC